HPPLEGCPRSEPRVDGEPDGRPRELPHASDQTEREPLRGAEAEKDEHEDASSLRRPDPHWDEEEDAVTEGAEGFARDHDTEGRAQSEKVTCDPQLGHVHEPAHQVPDRRANHVPRSSPLKLGNLSIYGHQRSGETRSVQTSHPDAMEDAHAGREEPEAHGD